MSDETLAVELFRLRYTLREAVNTGEVTEQSKSALERLRQVASGRGDLLFEYRRWCIQLELAKAA